MVKLVLFTAKWCPPCKVLKPTIEAFRKEHPDVVYEEIDVDKKANADRCEADRIMAVPTMIMYATNERIWRVSGVVGTRALNNALVKAQAKEG